MRNFLQLDKDLTYIKDRGYSRVVGIDEVGRGSWAGPVAVGAYILDIRTPFVEGVNDSKKLLPKKREYISKMLQSHNHTVHLGSVELINSHGIGQSITRLIKEIIEKYNSTDTFFLIDGQFTQNFGKNTLKVIKGDATYYSIAAASILAKVYRDNIMKSLADSFPGYGFERNVGYPTKEHINNLSLLGPTAIHRTSFEPIARSLAGN